MSSLGWPFSGFHGTWNFFLPDEIEIMATARTEMRDGRRTKPNPAGTCRSLTIDQGIRAAGDTRRLWNNTLILLLCRLQWICIFTDMGHGNGECRLQKGARRTAFRAAMATTGETVLPTEPAFCCNCHPITPHHLHGAMAASERCA